MGSLNLLFLLVVLSLHSAWSVKPTTGTTGRSKARAIYDAWTEMYGLNDTSAPPATVKFPTLPKILKSYPWAPHLENCQEVSAKRRAVDKRKKDRSLPDWSCEQNVTMCAPMPPWIRGSDQDNLHLTRVVQADIWQHQNPENCSALDKVFIVSKWPSTEEHDLASQIHMMSAILSIAMYYDRVFVPYPGTFKRAQHDGCKGSKYGNWDCYFFPMVSKACEKRAMSLITDKSPRFENLKNPTETLESDEPVILLDYSPFDWHVEANSAVVWDEPWEKDPETVELLGEVSKQHPDSRKANWWRSQAVRFFLRYPSPYLCHLTNVARHQAYGKKVAGAHMSQLRLLKSTETGEIAGVNFTGESLASTLWRSTEPFLPRPIVSIHAVQPETKSPSDEVNFSVYAWVAEVLKLHEPGMHNVWVTTFYEKMISEARMYSHWNLYHADHPRYAKYKPIHEIEKDAGVKRITESNLVNLMISTECDYFVGALETEWSRLINEVRQTNGKLRVGFVSINLEEFEDINA